MYEMEAARATLTAPGYTVPVEAAPATPAPRLWTAQLDPLPDEYLIAAAREALTRPDSFGYSGDLPLFDTWGIMFSQDASSDALARSNYRRILEDLRRVAAMVTDDPEEYVQEIHCRHWLVGWMDHILVKVMRDGDESPERANAFVPSNITTVFQWAASIAVRLRDEYPVYDEFDYSDLESEEDWDSFVSEWDGMVSYWDEGDDGPEPDDDERDFVHRFLTDSETPDGYDPDELLATVKDGRAGTLDMPEWLRSEAPANWPQAVTS